MSYNDETGAYCNAQTRLILCPTCAAESRPDEVLLPITNHEIESQFLEGLTCDNCSMAIAAPQESEDAAQEWLESEGEESEEDEP